MPSVARTWWADVLLITVLAGFLYGMFLGVRPLEPPDEGRYSEIPREMVVTGDYVTPHLNGVTYFEKPALFYWLQAFSIKTFGTSEWSLRLANAIMGIFGCIATYLGARSLYNRRTGLLAGAILGTSLLYSGLSRFITIDITMTTLLTGGLLCFLLGNKKPPGWERRYYMWALYIFAALATLTKGLIGIIFPGLVIFTWLLVTRKWHELRHYCLFSGTVLFLLIALPWHLLAQIRNPDFAHFYFYEQHFLRYFTQYAGRHQPIWFLPFIMIVGTFPWTGFVAKAVENTIAKLRRPRSNPIEVYLALWAGLIFIFYWLSQSQLAPYTLPIFPPLAILTAAFIEPFWDEDTRKLRGGFALSVVMALLLSMGGIFSAIYIKKHFISVNILLLIAGTSLLVACAFYFCYRKKKVGHGIVAMLMINILFQSVLFFAFSFYKYNSVKPIANTLKKVMVEGENVYNYNHYFQDLPFYLGKTVRLMNWKGELLYGSLHQPPTGTFIHENDIWNTWQSSDRKFLVMQKSDFNAIRSILKELKFYPIALTDKFILVCNKDLHP